MENKQAQKQWVIDRLNKNGYISRNECLSVYISRLGAIIHTLKQEGWIFDARYKEYYNTYWNRKAKDYVYTVLYNPTKEDK